MHECGKSLECEKADQRRVTGGAKEGRPPQRRQETVVLEPNVSDCGQEHRVESTNVHVSTWQQFHAAFIETEGTVTAMTQHTFQIGGNVK